MQKIVIIPKNIESIDYASGIFYDLSKNTIDISIDFNVGDTINERINYYINDNFKIIVVDKDNIEEIIGK